MGSGISIHEGLFAAWRFLAPAWRGAWLAIVVASLALALLGATRLTAATLPWTGPALAVVLASAVSLQGSLYRIALDEGRSGPGGIQWTALEWRLCLTWLLTGAFLAVSGLLFLVVALSAAYAVASTGAGFVGHDARTWAGAVDDRGRVVLGGVGLAILAGFSWIFARLRLAPAATVARRQVQVLSIWPLTRNAAWKVAASGLMVAAPPGLMVFLLGILPLAGLARDFAAAVILAGLWLPMSVGLSSYFYQRLSGGTR